MIRYNCFHRGCGDDGPFGHTHYTGFAYYLGFIGFTTLGLGLLWLWLKIS